MISITDAQNCVSKAHQKRAKCVALALVKRAQNFCKFLLTRFRVLVEEYFQLGFDPPDAPVMDYFHKLHCRSNFSASG
jgi:hypothetical protein